MRTVPSETDFIVVGAGIAGLRASVELASAGRVLCLAKREVTESNTQYAQGGIAAALSDDDEVSLHLDDTLKAGDGLSNAEAARVLVEEGPTSHLPEKAPTAAAAYCTPMATPPAAKSDGRSISRPRH